MRNSINYYELVDNFLFITNYVNFQNIKVKPLDGYVSTILLPLANLFLYPYVLTNTNRENVNEVKGTEGYFSL